MGLRHTSMTWCLRMLATRHESRGVPATCREPQGQGRRSHGAESPAVTDARGRERWEQAGATGQSKKDGHSRPEGGWAKGNQEPGATTRLGRHTKGPLTPGKKPCDGCCDQQQGMTTSSKCQPQEAQLHSQAPRVLTSFRTSVVLKSMVDSRFVGEANLGTQPRRGHRLSNPGR